MNLNDNDEVCTTKACTMAGTSKYIFVKGTIDINFDLKTLFMIKDIWPNISILAGDILAKLDETADPCQDMVQFACGGWFENNEIPPSENRWGVFNELESKINSVLHGKKDLVPIHFMLIELELYNDINFCHLLLLF